MFAPGSAHAPPTAALRVPNCGDVLLELYSGNDSDETNEGDSAITSERQFWLRIIEVGLLTVPGWHFLPNRAAVPQHPPPAAAQATKSSTFAWVTHRRA